VRKNRKWALSCMGRDFGSESWASLWARHQDIPHGLGLVCDQGCYAIESANASGDQRRDEHDMP
jgi:hypothetical protein